MERLGCRCVLKVPLPSWPHCCDHLTVWRRVSTCTLLLCSLASSSSKQPATCPPKLVGESPETGDDDRLPDVGNDSRSRKRRNSFAGTWQNGLEEDEDGHRDFGKVDAVNSCGKGPQHCRDDFDAKGPREVGRIELRGVSLVDTCMS
jgi:hypothetical protein